jgi:hypothetical protein
MIKKIESNIIQSSEVVNGMKSAVSKCMVQQYKDHLAKKGEDISDQVKFHLTEWLMEKTDVKLIGKCKVTCREIDDVINDIIKTYQIKEV